MAPRKKLLEQNSKDITGFDNEVVKITDATTGNAVCHIGLIHGIESVYFTRPMSLEDLEAIVELMNKKKMQKHLTNGNYDKAEEFANRKFHK